jgi:peptide-methionine (S)-S-oxide reductase
MRSSRLARAAAPAALAVFVLFAACNGAAPQPTANTGAPAPNAHPTATTTPSPAPSTPAPSSAPMPTNPPANPTNPPASPASKPGTAIATLANGCFWCTEAVLEQLDGVLDATSGYMGGTVDDPTYQQVCSGTTGHAECTQVTFDPAKISYATLLDWFFRSHDPTTLNRQGADEGTQYRSAIFFHDAAQQAEAHAAIRRHQPDHGSPIVTEVTAASRFWPAEPYHQDYFRNNPAQGYCRRVIAPKLKKLGLQDAK